MYAAIGSATPAIAIAASAICHFSFHDIHPIDRKNDLARLPALILIPSSGLALLFGLAAFGSHRAKHGLSFTRSLIVISIATLIAVFATRPRVQRKSVEPDVWMEVVIPIAVALIATIGILLYNKLTASRDSGSQKLDANENAIAR